MSQQPEPSFKAYPICCSCGELIVEEDAFSAHIHHDYDTCDFFPFDKETAEVQMHELSCKYVLFYHEECCRKCGHYFAGV